MALLLLEWEEWCSALYGERRARHWAPLDSRSLAQGAGTYVCALSAQRPATCLLCLATVHNSRCSQTQEKCISAAKENVNGESEGRGVSQDDHPRSHERGLVQGRSMAPCVHSPGRVNTDGTRGRVHLRDPCCLVPGGPTWRNNTPNKHGGGDEEWDGNDSLPKTAILQGEVQLFHYFCQLSDLERC